MRKRIRAVTSAVAGISLLLGTAWPCAPQAQAAQESEYIVMMEDSADVAELCADRATDVVHGDDEQVLADANACTLSLTKSEASNLERDDDVRFVEENIVFEAAGVEDEAGEPDPGLAEDEGDGSGESVGALWNRDFVHASPEEVGGADGSGVRVAVLDSGLVSGSSYERGERADMVGNDLEDPMELHCDLSGHGTAVNTVLATLAPGAQVDSVRVLDADNRAPLSRVVAGLQWAIDNHADIVNMSFGSARPSEILHAKLREAYDAGILLVGAAGNTGRGGKVLYPAAYDEVVSVGSVDAKGDSSGFSPEGAEISAPGEGIVAEGLFGGSASVEGTSVAAPHVSAAAALVMSGERGKDAEWVRRLLDASANTTRGETGIVDAGMAWADRASFSEGYTPGKADYDADVDTREGVEDLGADVIVSGQWSKTNHEKQANEVGNDFVKAGKVKSEYIQLMAKVAYYADEYYPIGDNGAKRFYPLHAFGATNLSTSNSDNWDNPSTDYGGTMNSNYVADLKYLYRMAAYFRDSNINLATDSGCTRNGDLTSPPSGVKAPGADKAILWQIVASKDPVVEKSVCKGKEKDVENWKKSKGIIHSNLLSSFSSSEKRKAASWAILGLAVHMAGDIYAHRTRVPKTATGPGKPLDKTSPVVNFRHSKCKKTSSSVELKEYLKKERNYVTSRKQTPSDVCMCKTCVLNEVESAHVEFRDIPYVTKIENSDNDSKDKTALQFDDKTTIYPQRFSAGTKNAVKQLITRFINGDEFSIYVFLHAGDGYGNYTLKLNGLKQYIDATSTKQFKDFEPETQALITKYSTGVII